MSDEIQKGDWVTVTGQVGSVNRSILRITTKAADGKSFTVYVDQKYTTKIDAPVPPEPSHDSLLRRTFDGSLLYAKQADNEWFWYSGVFGYEWPETFEKYGPFIEYKADGEIS